ncbi:MAG: hypothetical protein AAB353_11505 [Candidatus Hydrogenedentota bacterium]
MKDISSAIQVISDWIFLLFDTLATTVLLPVNFVLSLFNLNVLGN